MTIAEAERLAEAEIDQAITGYLRAHDGAMGISALVSRLAKQTGATEQTVRLALSRGMESRMLTLRNLGRVVALLEQD